MKRWILMLGIAASCLGTVPVGFVAVGAARAQDMVGQREASMKQLGANLQAIKAVVDASGPMGAVVPRAEDMRDYFARMAQQFPAGSEGGKAAPAVWSDRAGFERAVGSAGAAAAKLASASAANDGAAVAAAFREVAASCGACHRTYRSR